MFGFKNRPAHDEQPGASVEFREQALVHLDGLFGAALRLTRNETEAEDLVQEAVMRAWKNWHRFKQGTNCRAWIFRILTNTFINGYRRKRTEREFLEAKRPGTLVDTNFLGDAAASWSNPEIGFEQRNLSPVVQEALTSLRPEYRMVVVLSDLRGFAYKEIAAIMECPIGTVMSRLFRARRQLRELLTEHVQRNGYFEISAEAAA